MTTTATRPNQRPRAGFTLPSGTHVCLVTAWSKLADRFTQVFGGDQVRVKHQLADLIGEEGCQFAVVDTKVRDLSIWPAPLLLASAAPTTAWLFLMEDLGDSTLLRGTPQDCAFFERRIEAVDEVFDYISRRLQPDADRRIERVGYLQNVRSFVVRLENGRVYALKLDDVSEADQSDVLRYTLSKNRHYFRVVQVSGNILEIPWDTVLYHCEPNYEHYKGKAQHLDDGDRAGRIGQRVRELRTQKGLSVTELANRVGMQRPNLSRLESGRHLPSLDTLERIADALEVPVAELIAVNSARFAQTSPESRS